MTAAGKVNASKVTTDDRIIVSLREDGTITESRTKTGENVRIVRVIGKTFRSAQGPYEARGKYIIETAIGSFEAATIQTMFLAPEDAAGIKRAHVEALAMDKQINRAATAEEIAAPAEADRMRSMMTEILAADTNEDAAEIVVAVTGVPAEDALRFVTNYRPQEKPVTMVCCGERYGSVPDSMNHHCPIKVEKMDEVVGTMRGHRAIRIDFKMKDGAPGASVTFDFYGNGAAFNGATYARIESAALRAMADAGRINEVETFSNRLIR